MLVGSISFPAAGAKPSRGVVGTNPSPPPTTRKHHWHRALGSAANSSQQPTCTFGPSSRRSSSSGQYSSSKGMANPQNAQLSASASELRDACVCVRGRPPCGSLSRTRSSSSRAAACCRGVIGAAAASAPPSASGATGSGTLPQFGHEPAPAHTR